MESENLYHSSSWISTIALREAADIKQEIKSTATLKSSQFSSELLNTKKLPSHISKTSSSSPKAIHHRFNSNALEFFNSFENSESESTGGNKRALCKISRLNEEIQILSEQLKIANETISGLTDKITEINSKHALHIQALQERHEQKIKRLHQELEFVLSSSQNYKKTEIDKITNEHQMELDTQQEVFQEKFSFQEMEFTKELEKKDVEYQQKMNSMKYSFMGMITKLKSKFLEELNYVESKYKMKIKFIKKFRKKYGSIAECDEEGSTIAEMESEKSRGKDCDSSLQAFFENSMKDISRKHSEIDLRYKML